MASHDFPGIHPMKNDQDLADVALELTRRWERAWNEKDSASMAELLVGEVEWVTVSGKRLSGRQQFEQVHRELFAGALRSTSWAGRTTDVQRVSEDVALVTYTWTVSGETDATGGTKPARLGIFSWLLVRRAAGWRVRLGHGTNIQQV